MRQTTLTILLSICSICAHAQSAYDGLMFSENDYEGTARSVAMGNAFTALGGDLGSINLNPAGSAVAGYSQFTVTPGLTFSAATAQGVSPYANGTLPYFERHIKSNMTRFSIPNAGLTMNWDTNRSSGLKNITFGFVMNRTATWDEDVYANGTNSTTSFMGSLAYQTDGIPAAELNSEYAYDNIPWNSVVGYGSNMISPYGPEGNRYAGASQLVFDTGLVLGGPLEQSYGRRVTGGKNDYVFNIGANFSDFLYIGVNLGMTSIDYNMDEYFKEAAVDPTRFNIAFTDGSAYFESMKYKYSYSANGSGVYGKFGAIVTPGAGFRIGAAISTPVANEIVERWSMSGETTFSSSKYNGYEASPEGEYRYTFISPFRANFGLAYTFRNIAILSADYELCDYSTMEFRADAYDKDVFDEVNRDIRTRFGLSHMFRAGAEVKIGALSVRAGYGLTTSPEEADAEGKKIPVSAKPLKQNISFGLGYSSKGSFFADFAMKRNFVVKEYYMPYPDYEFDSEGEIIEYAPELLISKSAWKAVLTLGWRF